MKKTLIFAIFLLCFASKSLFAQTTNLTLQVTDTAGQAWFGGTWYVDLRTPGGVTPFGPPFYNVNTTTPVPNQSQTGTLSGTGSATMTLTQNAGIVPANSRWRFTVCPQATSTGGCFVQFVVITATATLTLNPPPPSVIAGVSPGAIAYSDAEVLASVGQVYYNLTLTSLRVCQTATGTSCSVWASAGSGSGLPTGPSSPNGVPSTLISTPSGGVPGTGTYALSGVPTDARTTTTETISATDRNGYVTFSNAGAVAVTLPQAGSGGGTNSDFTNNFAFRACNIGVGTVTITPTTSTISYTNGSAYTSGASSLVLTTGQCASIFSNNTNYFANVYTGGSAGGAAQIYAWPIQNVIAGSTTTVCLAFSPSSACAASGNDNRVGTPVGLAGTVQSMLMWINQSANVQPGTGNFVCTLRINGVSSTSVITIASGATVTTLQSDITHHPTVVQGDLLAMQCVNNATTNSIVPTTIVVAIQ